MESPPVSVIAKERSLIQEILEPELLLRLEPLQSKIIRTNYPILRTAISDPRVFDIQPFESSELEIVGKQVGEATLTFWYDVPGKGTQVLRYFVQVINSRQEERMRAARYKETQSRLNELFPNSQLILIPIEDKLVVRGQVRDSREAQQIIQILGQGFIQNLSGGSNVGGGFGGGRFGAGGVFGGNAFGFGQGGFFGNQNFGQQGSYGRGTNPNGGFGSGPIPGAQDLAGTDDDIGTGIGINPRNIINQLRVAGEQQVMLKVRVAELVRTSGRGAGLDISVSLDNFQFSHLISGGGGNISAILEDPDVSFFLQAITAHSYGKILAEPTLITLSGRPANFHAGGEFAVPTTVGIGGVGAASTTFRGFGTQLTFTPTIVDKDLIRLQVSPSFSSINNDATVGGIPGLSRRSVDTTVDLREGQWLAIAGMIQDEQGGQRTRTPFLGDLPVIGNLFGSQNTTRTETELIVLVSPELVHPLETEQVPLLLPGMEVTDPTDDDFFLRHQTEGYRGVDYRSTVNGEYQAHVNGYKSDKFNRQRNPYLRRQMQVERAYVNGPSGFSK